MGLLKEKFGLRLKELRKSKGLTQEQVAEFVGIEPVNVSKIERGMHFPQPEKIEKFAIILGVSTKDLFDFEHIKDKKELIKNIEMSLKNFDLKELEFVYKFVSDLKLYK